MEAHTIDQFESKRGTALTYREPWTHIAVGVDPQTKLPVIVRVRDRVSGENPIQRASVMRHRETGQLLVTEEDSAEEPNRALVLIRISRGGNELEWTRAHPLTTDCPNRGKSLTRNSFCEVCGTTGDPDWKHPDRGTYTAYQTFPPDDIVILAEGIDEQPKETYEVMLLIMHSGAMFRIVAGPETEQWAKFILWTGEQLRIGSGMEILDPAREPLEHFDLL